MEGREQREKRGEPLPDGRRGTSGDAAWQNDVAEVIARIGSPDLPHVLDRALRGLAPFDLSVIFAYPSAVRPLLLHDGLRSHRPGPAMENYLNGGYLLDPFYVACAGSTPPGLYRMRELAPDAFFEGEYVGNWEVHPCISMESGSLAEEIGYVVTLPSGSPVVYSLMRSAGGEPFAEAECDRLRRAEPIVREALRTQWRHLGEPIRGDVLAPADERASVVLDRAFADFCAGLLSKRERMVTQLILRGHSARSIAGLLDIAEGTVKNHRKSIYGKLGIASQQELFSRFLAHALSRGES